MAGERGGEKVIPSVRVLLHSIGEVSGYTCPSNALSLCAHVQHWFEPEIPYCRQGNSHCLEHAGNVHLSTENVQVESEKRERKHKITLFKPFSFFLGGGEGGRGEWHDMV